MQSSGHLPSARLTRTSYMPALTGSSMPHRNHGVRSASVMPVRPWQRRDTSSETILVLPCQSRRRRAGRTAGPWPAGNSTRRPPYPHGDPCGWEGFGSTPLPRCPTLLSVRVAHPLNPRPWEFGQSPGSGSGSCTLGLDGPPPGVACYRGGNCPRCLMSAAPHARPLLTRRVRPSSQDGDDAFAYL